MIRTLVTLMVVFNSRNRLAAEIRDWINSQISAGEFWVDLRAVAPDALRTAPGTSDFVAKVRDALQAAEAAIVVLSPDDCVTQDGAAPKKNYFPRPNVSFELGFLLSRLRPQKIELIADCSVQSDWLSDQPSDVLNLFQKRCNDLNEAKPIIGTLLDDLGATRRAHTKWGEAWELDDVRPKTFDAYAEWLKLQLKSARDRNNTGLGWKVALEHIQLLLDNRGAPNVDPILTDLPEPPDFDREAVQAFSMVKAMLYFWAVHPTVPETKLIEAVQAKLNRVANETTWTTTIENPLIRVLYCDYKGLVCETIGRFIEPSEKHKWFEQAARWYEEAARGSEVLRGHLRDLWLGYVTFNLAKVTPDKLSRDENYAKACLHRREACRAARGTTFERSTRSQLILAVGSYVSWLSEMKNDKGMQQVVYTYRDDIEEFLRDQNAPQNALEARALTSLLSNNQGQALSTFGVKVPPSSDLLCAVAEDVAAKIGPALRAGYWSSRATS